MDHTKTLQGSGGLEMEMKGKLFKFSSFFPTLIRPYLALFRLVLMHLSRGLSPDWIIPPCVRASVPLLREAQNLWFRTILSEISESHLCILQFLADAALKTHDKIDTFSAKCSKHIIK